MNRFRVETVGSTFEIDDDHKRYRRWPKPTLPEEEPHPPDGLWHEFVSWHMAPDFGGGRRFVIVVEVRCDGRRSVVSARM